MMEPVKPTTAEKANKPARLLGLPTMPNTDKIIPMTIITAILVAINKNPLYEFLFKICEVCFNVNNIKAFFQISEFLSNFTYT